METMEPESQGLVPKQRTSERDLGPSSTTQGHWAQYLDELTDERSHEYKEIARREVQLFQAVYGKSCEALAFPTLWFSWGHFDDAATVQRSGMRFRDYRHFLMGDRAPTQFKRQAWMECLNSSHIDRIALHPVWPDWSALVESDLRCRLSGQLVWVSRARVIRVCSLRGMQADGHSSTPDPRLLRVSLPSRIGMRGRNSA